MINEKASSDANMVKLSGGDETVTNYNTTCYEAKRYKLNGGEGNLQTLFS